MKPTPTIPRNSVDRTKRLINLDGQEYGFFPMTTGQVLVLTRPDADGYQELNRKLSKDAARALWTHLARLVDEARAEEAASDEGFRQLARDERAYERHLDDLGACETATEFD